MPDPRVLRDRRAAEERADFVKAVVDRASRSEVYARIVQPMVADLMSMLPVSETPLSSLLAIGTEWATVGRAVADEEQVKGWARPGQVDAIVRCSLDWDLRNAATQATKGWIQGTVATYMLDAGYYLARTDDRDRPVIANGMAQFAKEVADDQARSSGTRTDGPGSPNDDPYGTHEQEPARAKTNGHMIGMPLSQVFGDERTVAAFRWIDEELAALPLDAPFAPWLSDRRDALVSRLPPSLTQGFIPRELSLPDDLLTDLCRFVLIEELFWELTHGPPGGMILSSGDKTLGTLPPLAGGWGSNAVWAGDVLRWFRGWIANPLPSTSGEEVAATRVTTLEDARQHRILECLHDELDLQAAYADWCEEQNLPNVVVRGPYREKDNPDGLLFLVGLDLSRTNYRLNRRGLEAASARLGRIKSWGASTLPDDQIPDSRFARIATDGFLSHEAALELGGKWLEIALDPEFTDSDDAPE